MGGNLHEGGWDSAWTEKLATTPSNLSCDLHSTWTKAPGANEGRSINCATWLEAYAFCIWDGGFLPSETEWNFAASGGAEQRLYPWSKPAGDPTIDCTFANYGGTDAAAPRCVDNVVDPGGYPKADGKWGHADLAGNVFEWTLDGYAEYVNPCSDCVNLLPPRVLSCAAVRSISYPAPPRPAFAPPTRRPFALRASDCVARELREDRLERRLSDDSNRDADATCSRESESSSLAKRR